MLFQKLVINKDLDFGMKNKDILLKYTLKIYQVYSTYDILTKINVIGKVRHEQKNKDSFLVYTS